MTEGQPLNRFDEVYNLGMQMLDAQDDGYEVLLTDEHGEEFVIRIEMGEDAILEDIKKYTKIIERHNGEKPNADLKLAMLHLDKAALYLDVYLKGKE